MISIYFNPDCSKCNTTHCMLEDRGEEFKTIEYLKSPPNREELKELIRMLNIEPFELMRKSEPLFIENFLHKDLSPEECIDAMLTHPILIERPIVVQDGKAIICRPPEKLWDLIKKT